MSEVVGVGCEIHITQMYHLTCCMALLKVLWWKGMISWVCAKGLRRLMTVATDRGMTRRAQRAGVIRRVSGSGLYRSNDGAVV